MTLHRVYGLTIDTHVPFGPLLDPGASVAVDWTVRWRDEPVDLDAEPEGVRIVEAESWPSYRSGAQVVVWSTGHGRFEIDLEARTISVALFERNEEVARLLLRGVVMSVVLELEALPVLHANAIDVGGDAIAFTGPQGAGKTTTTTALCATGFALLTDDVVPLERIGGVLGSRSGLTDLRLRPAATPLLDLFPNPGDTTTSIDGRVVLALPPHPKEWLPLHSVLVPWPSDDHTGEDRVEPISRHEALITLLGAFRVPGFQDQQLANDRLAIVGEVLRTLPVGRLLMPRRELWTPDDAAACRAAVEAWHAEVRA
jgi:hypothetical protein